MSDFRERLDEERLQLMVDDEFSPATPYEGYLAGLSRPDFEGNLANATGLPVRT